MIKFTILHSTLVNWYLFALSMILCLMHGLGFYGYGNDFYASYSGQNLRWGGIFDIVGFAITTLYIFDIHLGVYLTTFAIMFSFGYFAKSFCLSIKRDPKHSVILVLLYGHAWPIFMTTSNAMRQGLSMAVLFLVLGFILSSNGATIFRKMLILPGIFFHKISPLIIGVVLLTGNRTNKQLFLLAIIGIILLIGFQSSGGYSGEKRSIGINLTPILLLISTLTIITFFLKLKKRKIFSKIIISLNFLYILSIPFLNTWQSERIGFSIIIPTIFYLSLLLKRRYIIPNLYFFGITLITLSWYVGLFSSFK